MIKLAQVRKIALSLPEATEEPHFNRTSFRIRGKIFATAAPDDPFLNVMLGESGREPALAIHADCVEKLFWGKKAIGVRIDLRSAKPGVVRGLLAQAWERKAPDSLIEQGSKVSK